MKDIFSVASYICNRYEKEFGERIDEMKLHKLLYFTQRECLIQTEQPMFEEQFEGWRLGPVAPMIRKPYQEDSFDKEISDKDVTEYLDVLDYVFDNYAGESSWSLSLLSHGEICWKSSRKGFAPNASSNVPIPTENIRRDAYRMKERRAFLTPRGQI